MSCEEYVHIGSPVPLPYELLRMCAQDHLFHNPMSCEDCVHTRSPITQLPMICEECVHIGYFAP